MVISNLFLRQEEAVVALRLKSISVVLAVVFVGRRSCILLKRTY